MRRKENCPICRWRSMQPAYVRYDKTFEPLTARIKKDPNDVYSGNRHLRAYFCDCCGVLVWLSEYGEFKGHNTMEGEKGENGHWRIISECSHRHRVSI